MITGVQWEIRQERRRLQARIDDADARAEAERGQLRALQERCRHPDRVSIETGEAYCPDCGFFGAIRSPGGAA